MFENIKDFLKKAKNQMISAYKNSKSFVNESRMKFGNLYQTNYNTGMYHFNHGNLWDATFRFKIIKKFWPNELEGQYMYAYCLILQGLNNDAEKVLTEILKKDSSYIEAEELLEKIDDDETKSIIEEYTKRFETKNNEETN